MDRRRAAASETTRSVISKLGGMSRRGWASLQWNGMRTASTPVRAMSAQCGRCAAVRAGASGEASIGDGLRARLGSGRSSAPAGAVAPLDAALVAAGHPAVGAQGRLALDVATVVRHQPREVEDVADPAVGRAPRVPEGAPT